MFRPKPLPQGELIRLKNRQLSDKDYSTSASVISFYVRPSGEMLPNGERTYYVQILKKYLDMLQHNDLCIRAVLEKMRNANSIPGTTLLSLPFPLPGSNQARGCCLG
jgi:hypothetical protein